MTTQVKTFSELVRALEKELEDTTKRVGEDKVTNHIKKQIDKTIYQSYFPNSPQSLPRTYALRDSVVLLDSSKSNNLISVSVGHNREKLNHTSINTEKDFKYLPEVLQTGTVGAFLSDWGKNSASGKLYWKNARYYKPSHTFAHARPYMALVKKDLAEGLFKDYMTEDFRKKGFNVIG